MRAIARAAISKMVPVAALRAIPAAIYTQQVPGPAYPFR
jgi:hypothetical protein